NDNPYDMYKSCDLTKGLIKTIDDLHVEELIFDQGVNLGDLTWKAVIPLYVKNKFEVEDIKGVVDFDLGDFDGVNNVDKLIEYYEAVKSD
ncbi:hypothetical protein R0J87_20720, partial [Halomonas sp. SIMBA_159]